LISSSSFALRRPVRLPTRFYHDDVWSLLHFTNTDFHDLCSTIFPSALRRIYLLTKQKKLMVHLTLLTLLVKLCTLANFRSKNFVSEEQVYLGVRIRQPKYKGEPQPLLVSSQLPSL
jgi:hypothetical protein